MDWDLSRRRIPCARPSEIVCSITERFNSFSKELVSEPAPVSAMGSVVARLPRPLGHDDSRLGGGLANPPLNWNTSWNVAGDI